MKINKLNNIKAYLLAVNVLLISFLILFSNLGVLPFKNASDFWFVVFVVFILALYRPGWVFLFFIGTIMLENINLAPENFGLMIRPYQLLGGMTLLAVMIRHFTKRLNFKLPKFLGNDWLVVIFTVAGFLSVYGAENRTLAFKQAIIIASFAVLYFLVRIFVQKWADIKKILPFFLSSSGIIILYGIWQNWIFLSGGNHFEIMPGRPNATFMEADWLGMFLVLVLSVLYALIYYVVLGEEKRKAFFRGISRGIFHIPYSIFYIALSAIFILLILTVSRSAWLGGMVISILYILYIIWQIGWKQKKWLTVWKNFGFVSLTFISSVVAVYFFNLTDFELGNRAVSVGGNQEITVSCSKQQKLPEIIKSVSELQQYNCRHINLEEIEKEKASGNFVTKIYRTDPNVNIRAEIYQKSWAEIKKHPVLGIGWGNIGQVLGNDERGVDLNSSNIFLEVWLGAGLLGLLSFVIILGNILRSVILNNEVWKLFIILSFFAIIIPNLFNAGIMLGFLWIWLGIGNIENFQFKIFSKK